MLMPLRKKIRDHGPLLFVLAAAAAAFLFFAVSAFASDIRALACNLLQDDSYYYLQPAWNFPRLGFFTFDGEHPTYGFQPLWMILLSLVSLFSPDKDFFLRAAVALGGLFFSLTGVALYFLLRRRLEGWRAVIAPVLWTANPALAGVFITGKENSLYAFLLIVSCWAVVRRRDSAGRSVFLAGIPLGLMVLARVNALVPAALLLLVYFLLGAGNRAVRGRRALGAAAGMLAVLLPWCLYAGFAFGTLFPNSGAAKLADSFAALAVFAGRTFPFLPADALQSLVPAAQRGFLARPDLLTLPTTDLAVSYGVNFLPDLAYGSWAGLFSFLGPLDFRIRIILLGAVFLAGAGWCLVEWRGSQPERKAVAAVVAVLLVSAAVNAAGNWLLMPAYLSWGVWYAVPEALALIVLPALAAVFPLGMPAAGLRAAPVRWVAAAAGILLTVAGLVQVARAWQPRDSSVALEATQEQAYRAAGWMDRNLPAGARVASFSAGLLGFFAQNVRVVNIDGLANTPQFVDRELTGHLLFVRGLADADPIREYIRAGGIRYLANVDTVERIAGGDFLGLTDPGGGTLLYEGDRPVIWGAGEPERRMIVVELGD